MKKFYIQTFGCQMNVYDSQRISNMLKSMDWVQIDEMPDADLIILNTCSIREKASNKVFSALGRIRLKKKPEALFGIVGCVARESGGDAFRRIPELNFVLGPQTYHKLPEILKNPDAKLLNIDLGGLEKFDELPQMIKSPTVSYIPIQEGCNHVCTYCIVPYTRGREISRPFQDVMRDTLHAANTGAVEICFLGQNVNGYKFKDIDGKTYTLSDLITQTAKTDNIKRIRFTSSYPTEMTDELINLFGTQPKLLPLLHLPIQSGSDNILNKMNRHYSLKEYTDIITKFKQVRDDIQVSTDFIVGFPGETEDDFNASMDIAKKIGYVNSYSFKYSPRPHTAAALMPNHIPENIKSERLKKLNDFMNEIQQDFNTSCIDKEMECLLEGPDKTGDNWVFRTPYMQQCIVKKTSDKISPLIKVRITKANKSSLRGELIK